MNDIIKIKGYEIISFMESFLSLRKNNSDVTINASLNDNGDRKKTLLLDIFNESGDSYITDATEDLDLNSSIIIYTDENDSLVILAGQSESTISISDDKIEVVVNDEHNNQKILIHDMILDEEIDIDL